MRLLSVLIIFFASMGIMTGCVTSQKQAQPLTAVECAIHQTFKSMEVAWKNCDKNTFMTFISEDASMMSGKERYILTKSQLADTYPAKMKNLGPIQFKVKKVNVEGNEANVKVVVVINYNYYPQTWTMTNEAGNWLASKNRY